MIPPLLERREVHFIRLGGDFGVNGNLNDVLRGLRVEVKGNLAKYHVKTVHISIQLQETKAFFRRIARTGKCSQKSTSEIPVLTTHQRKRHMQEVNKHPLGNLIPSTKLHLPQPHSKSKWANLERREQIKSLHRNGTIEKKLPERFSGGERFHQQPPSFPFPFLCQSPFKS
ncbi:hypothetical protein TNCV_5132921 [Trichonephila clavipes]|nr:hypothetical protein TNCV_5132921 [Trichonephila clavipes]